MGAQESGAVENGDGLIVVETSKGLDFAAGEESGETLARSLERSSPWTKKQHDGVAPEASIEITNGVASMEIPDEIFDESELLWKSYVVGYFIGDAPHVGSIHATVNRIWASPKGGSKIDVQFIKKNTVLFRIENSQMRASVVQRKHWHISDVPLVVNVWSPESALNPPDLSLMPMWVDLRGVPNNLYSHKGLRCLFKAAGKFVKLHPTTEKCVRLDVARVLVEVNLHQELVEKISFRDNAGTLREIGVAYPWLPPRCSVCRKWGHKGQDCVCKEVRILNKKTVAGSTFTPVPQTEDMVKRTEGNVIAGLMNDLEAITPHTAHNSLLTLRDDVLGGSEPGLQSAEKDLEPKKSMGQEELPAIQLSEPTTEAFPEVGGWETVHRKKHGLETEEDEVLVVSPSRFSPLQDIEEDIGEEEETVEGNATDGEEGEILENKTEGQRSQRTQATRGKKLVNGSVQKLSRTRVLRTKDLLHAGKQGVPKKSSIRKI